MPRSEPDGRVHSGENRAAWHGRMRGTFIVENLQHDPALEVGLVEMRETYLEWLGESGRDWAAPDIRQFYKAISCLKRST